MDATERLRQLFQLEQKEKSELKREIRFLRKGLELLEQHQFSSKEFIKYVVLDPRFKFTKMQKSLFIALSNCRPIESKELRKKIGTKSIGSLKELISKTRKDISDIPDGEKSLLIRPLRGKPFGRYQLEIKSHFVKNSFKK